MKNVFKNKTTREIMAFSLLPFGMSTIYGIMSTALNLYLTDVLGLSLAMTGIVLSATKVWDAVNDPMMGMIVDKTHTKMGKCRPYIFWMSFPVIIVTALLFAPVNFSQNGNFIYAIIAYLLYYTVYTALDIPYQGLTPLVFPEDKKELRQFLSATSSVRWVQFFPPSCFSPLPVCGEEKIKRQDTSEPRLFLQRSAEFPCSSPLSVSKRKFIFLLKKKSILTDLKLYSKTRNLYV